jgi:hypothetical protein
MLDRPQRAGKEEKKDERSGSWCLVVPRVPGGCQQPALAMPCCCCCAPACRRAPSRCSTTTRRVAALVISGQLVAGVRQSAGPFESPSNPGAHHPPGRARRQELSGSGLPLQQQLPVDIGDCVYGQRHFTRAIRQQRRGGRAPPAANPATRLARVGALPVSQSDQTPFHAPPAIAAVTALAVLARHASNGVLGSSRTGYDKPSSSAHRVRPPSPSAVEPSRPTASPPKPRSQHVPDRLRPAPGMSG